MAKKTKCHMFPTSCRGCEWYYEHWDSTPKISGGCKKTFGNRYCTKSKKHRKLLKRNVTYLRPPDCPISNAYPVIVPDDEC